MEFVVGEFVPILGELDKNSPTLHSSSSRVFNDIVAFTTTSFAFSLLVHRALHDWSNIIWASEGMNLKLKEAHSLTLSSFL